MTIIGLRKGTPVSTVARFTTDDDESRRIVYKDDSGWRVGYVHSGPDDRYDGTFKSWQAAMWSANNRCHICGGPNH